MADNPVTQDLKADLPETWAYSDVVSPNGTEAGKEEKYGFNYLMKQVNLVQLAAKAIGAAFANLVSKGEKVDSASYADNAGTVNSLTVQTAVPANAVFTDTTYSDATTSAHGLMSASDKSKLDGIAAGATNVTNNNQITNGRGFTTNTGTVTSVAVKMNSTVKGTITTSGTIDLGTVITAHQSLSAYATTSSVTTKLNRTDNVNSANTSYTTYMARGEALNSSDTTPTANGCISWTYE